MQNVQEKGEVKEKEEVTGDGPIVQGITTRNRLSERRLIK